MVVEVDSAVVPPRVASPCAVSASVTFPHQNFKVGCPVF